MLRNNAESRRAVVAQVLAYAAALHRATAEQMEREILARPLGGRTLFDVVRDQVQAELHLVTVSAYDISGRRVVVPQRVESGRRQRPEPETAAGQSAGLPRKGQLVPGIEAFRAQIVTAPEQHRALLEKFASWAERVASAGLAEVSTYFGKRGEVVGPASTWGRPR